MRHQFSHSKSYHVPDLLKSYNPAQNPVHNSEESSHYHSECPYYPLFMLNYYLSIREDKVMATKGNRRRKPQKKGEYTFVRITLASADKEAAKLYSEKSAKDVDAQITDVLQSGHKISFSYNETNDSVTCTFTGKPEESVNEYRMLTSFGSSWWVALCVNLYKHNDFFNDGVWEDMENDDDFG